MIFDFVIDFVIDDLGFADYSGIERLGAIAKSIAKCPNNQPIPESQITINQNSETVESPIRLRVVAAAIMTAPATNGSARIASDIIALV